MLPDCSCREQNHTTTASRGERRRRRKEFSALVRELERVRFEHRHTIREPASELGISIAVINQRWFGYTRDLMELSRQVLPLRDRNVANPSQFFLFCGSPVSATHFLKLVRIRADANQFGAGCGSIGRDLGAPRMRTTWMRGLSQATIPSASGSTSAAGQP